MTALSRARILEAIALLEKVLQEDEPVGLEPGAGLRASLDQLRKTRSEAPYTFPGSATGPASAAGNGTREHIPWQKRFM